MSQPRLFLIFIKTWKKNTGTLSLCENVGLLQYIDHLIIWHWIVPNATRGIGRKLLNDSWNKVTWKLKLRKINSYHYIVTKATSFLDVGPMSLVVYSVGKPRASLAVGSGKECCPHCLCETYVLYSKLRQEEPTFLSEIPRAENYDA
jgi:hypothetical protein